MGNGHEGLSKNLNRSLSKGAKIRSRRNSRIGMIQWDRDCSLRFHAAVWCANWTQSASVQSQCRWLLSRIVVSDVCVPCNKARRSRPQTVSRSIWRPQIPIQNWLKKSGDHCFKKKKEWRPTIRTSQAFWSIYQQGCEFGKMTFDDIEWDE